MSATAAVKNELVEGIEPPNTGGGGLLPVQNLDDKGITPLAVRYFCLSGKYRAQLNFTDESMQGSANALESLYSFVTNTLRTSGDAQAKTGDAEWQQAYKDKFIASINDDLKMTGALAAVHELVGEANRRGERAAVLPTMVDWDQVLGLKVEGAERRELGETLPQGVKE